MSTAPVHTDEELAARALGGDRDAFADLYERYFDRVFDLLVRMMRNPAEASDVAQDTFMKMLSGLDTRPPQVSFKAWLYAIARNASVDRLRSSRRTSTMSSVEMEGEELPFYQVATIPDEDPEQATKSEELAALVWEAAKGLNPNEYTLLDLNLRQGLEPQEIADVLDTTRGNVYTMLTRLRGSFEQSVTALLLTRRGREDCPKLNEILLRTAELDELSLRTRRAVNRHATACDICSSNRSRFVAASELFGAFVPILPAVALKDEVLSGLMEQFPAVVSSSAPAPSEVAPSVEGVEAASASSSAAASAAKTGLWASSSIIAKIAAIVGALVAVGVGAALVVTLVLSSDETSDDSGVNKTSPSTIVSPPGLSASPTTVAPSIAASLFGEPESYSIEGIGQIAVGGLDGDDAPDLALVNRETSTVSVLINNGDGTFADEVTYSVESFPGAITMGDLDGDNAPDLVTVLRDGRIL